MNNKLSINFSSLFLIIICLITLVIDFISYFTNLSYLYCLVISTLLILFLYVFFRKKIEIYFNLSKNDFIFYLVLLILFIIFLPYGDNSFDTINYHIYNQERPFIDKIFSDYFAGRTINTFSFLFGDRLFYLFRFLFKYKLGTSLNFLLLIVTYNNFKEILEFLLKKKSKVVDILSTFFVCSVCFIELINTYYVDFISLTLLIFLFKNVIKFSSNRYSKILIILVSSFAVCVKLSNIFYVLIFLLYFLLKNLKSFKHIKILELILYCFIFLIPLFIYLFYNYKQTGNPIFPFYNNIFKSKYYFYSNWTDSNYGSKNIFEFIFYPLYAIFNPSKASDSKIFEPMWGINYVISFIFLIFYYIKKEKNLNLLMLNILNILSYFIWIYFLIGYSRYGLMTYALGYLCYIIDFMYFIDKCRIKKILSFIFLFLVLFNFLYGLYFLSFSKSKVIRNLFNSGDVYIRNLKTLFNSNETNIDFPDNSAWIVMMHNAGEDLLINNSLPCINIIDNVNTNANNKILSNDITNYSHFYVSVSYDDFILFLHYLDLYGWSIVNYYDSIYLSYDDSLLYIFEITNNNSYFYEEDVSSTGERKIKVDNVSSYECDILFKKNVGMNKVFIEYLKDDYVVKLSYFETKDLFLHLNLDIKNYDYLKIRVISDYKGSCDNNLSYIFNVSQN